MSNTIKTDQFIFCNTCVYTCSYMLIVKNSEREAIQLKDSEKGCTDTFGRRKK